MRRTMRQRGSRVKPWTRALALPVNSGTLRRPCSPDQMRKALKFLAGLLALPVLYLLASAILPLVPGPGPDLSGPPTRAIGLIQGPIHTDILFPLTPETRTRFAFAEAAGVPLNHSDAEWLVLGWGSAAFYTTAGTYADITASAVLTAATGDGAVIRLDAFGALPPLENLRYLQLSEAQFQALLSQTADAFASQTRIDHPGFTGTDAFFPAHGHFSLLRTCNVWLGETLRAAGIPFGLWTPANWSVTLSLNRFTGQTG
jgi:uncharacterized protein (TIGR02117 family)